MFGKKRAPQNLKKRDAATAPGTDDDEGEAIIAIEKKKKITGKAPLVMTTQKRDNQEAEVVTHSYESARALNIGVDQRATATANYDTEEGRDHRSILERNEAIGKAILAGELEEGIYRGLGAIRPVVNRREGAVAAGKITGNYGPVRGNQHVRMTMRIDLNPEICKDYKETGYCGYGDTCIFLHDRSDYKSGWQLEKEWEEQQKAKQKKDARLLRKLERKMLKEAGEPIESDPDETSSSSSDNEDENETPLACQICKSKWTSKANAVVTQCKHYFCEKCALTHYTTSSKCAVCSEPTNGVFNSSSAVLVRL